MSKAELAGEVDVCKEVSPGTHQQTAFQKRGGGRSKGWGEREEVGRLFILPALTITAKERLTVD